MRIVKRILQWTICIICALYIGLLLAMHLPKVQEWAGTYASSAVQNLWGWDINIGRIKIGLWNRVIVDNIHLKDKNDSTMLHASRIAAKLDIAPLLNGRISIANAQVFGTKIKLYQESEDSKPNFQFIIDTFQSNDTVSKPINLHIGSLLLRRVDLQWDQHWKTAKDSSLTDFSHINISNLSITAHLRELQKDSLNISLRKLSFQEKSGLCLQNATLDAVAGNKGCNISNLNIQLPHSTITIPELTMGWDNLPDSNFKKWFENVSWHCTPTIILTPSDLKSFSNKLQNANEPITLEASIMGTEGCLNIPELNITNDGSFTLSTRAFIQDYLNSPICKIDIEKLQATSGLQQFITHETDGRERELSPILTSLDTIDITGYVQISKSKQNFLFKIHNHIGDIDINATADNWNSFTLNTSSANLRLGELFPQKKTISEISFDFQSAGMIKDKSNNPQFLANITLPKIILNEQEYNDIIINATYERGQLMADIEHADTTSRLHSHITYENNGKHNLSTTFSVENFSTTRLGLDKYLPKANIDFNAALQISGNDIDDMEGRLGITSFSLYSPNSNSLIIPPLTLQAETSIGIGQTRTIKIDSPILSLNAEGEFRPSTLFATIQNTLYQQIPNLFSAPTTTHTDKLQLTASLQDTCLIKKITGKNISLPKRVDIIGDINGSDSISMLATIPMLHYGKQTLRNTSINIQALPNNISADIKTEKKQKSEYINCTLSTNIHANRMRMVLGIDNNSTPHTKGDFDITAYFTPKTESSSQNIKAWIAPTKFTISDTLWHIHPATVIWEDGKININDFRINSVAKGNIRLSTAQDIQINGHLSKEDDDSVLVNLKNINVGYILNLVNFKPVNFQGKASGNIVAKNVLSCPHANAALTVTGFKFNYAPLGTLDVSANWGNTPHSLTLDAEIKDTNSNHHTSITGGFNIGDKEKKDGLDLRINTSRFNLAFINYFTKGIIEEAEGRVSGYCRIFGPFKGIDLEGDFVINQASMSMPILGTKYFMQGDSVKLSPGEIDFKGVVHDKKSPSFETGAKDYASLTNSTPHTGIVNGKLCHTHFKNMTYAFDVVANNLLGYDFKEFGNESYFATCYASGNININGGPGVLNVEVNATPEEGTVFTYNVATPETLTKADFITIKEGKDKGRETNQSADNSTQAKVAEIYKTNVSSDLFLNFNMNLTPSARLKLLMNPKTGEMAELTGSGRIMAKYHNKGRFNIYGTYRVHDGNYNISIQDIISRDFKFQPNGTIVFGGDAMKADLNLKAIYTVNGVSLDDLATSPLGFSKTKVNCVMNLTGRPEHPLITFDFELPEASEDERQMIRSIVSTEEERNIQAIYLLGLGRFFNFEGDGGVQSSSAMNSLISSTLSTQLNQFISHAVGQSNWSFGTSLKTGDDGWRNMDIEGTFRGKLFNNRLLINGNFGYREKYYTQRSFISDVNVEYLITKNGNISVKAYNQANDRYFIQSSLNTQGVGIQFKKDFNKWKELFYWLFPDRNTKSSKRNITTKANLKN